MAKQKTCPVCKNKWQPFSSMEKVCPTVRCAVKYIEIKNAKAKAKEDKAFRAETKRLKEMIKPKGKWLKEAQAAFNKFIRLRDKGLPCISCDRKWEATPHLTGSIFDAGHYRSTGSMATLRFEESNCHAQCVRCNRNLSGNVAEYRIRLVKRIGEEKLSWLEGPHEPKKYTIEDLKETKALYSKKAKELEKQIDA